MSTSVRYLAAVASALALLGSAGCGATGGGSETPPPPKDELASVNPCDALTPQDLAASGLPESGQPENKLPWKPGCEYDSDELGLTVYKDTNFTVDRIKTQSQWVKWDQIDVNGRPAVTAVNGSSADARVCSTMFDSGRGRIEVMVGTNNPDNNSQCQKSQEIAKQIEPRMPKKQ